MLTLRRTLALINWFTYYILQGLYPCIRTISTAEYADAYYCGDDHIYILCAVFGKHEGWYILDWCLPPVPGDDSRGCYYVNGKFTMPEDFGYASLKARDVIEYDDIPF